MSDQCVVELWRYPVKSMGGERLEVADIDEWGITGDRQWAVVAAVALCALVLLLVTLGRPVRDRHPVRRGASLP